jgi:prophage maintenance system killer protein
LISYLTTHDIVWVNNTVTGKVNRFDYMALEAAMAAQYQYGDSRNVLLGASNLLEKLLFKPAFADGNNRTALIATLSFLNANGHATKVGEQEAAQIVLAVARQERTPQQAIDDLGAPAQNPLEGLTLRQLIIHECNLHGEALRLLAEGD